MECYQIGGEAPGELEAVLMEVNGWQKEENRRKAGEKTYLSIAY